MAAPVFNTSPGMILLGIWLLLSGLAGILTFSLPPFVMPFLAVVAGMLILLGE